MTPSEYVKSKGFPTLQAVADNACITRYRLTRWYKYEPEVFTLIIDGLILREMMERVR